MSDYWKGFIIGAISYMPMWLFVGVKLGLWLARNSKGKI